LWGALGLTAALVVPATVVAAQPTSGAGTVRPTALAPQLPRGARRLGPV